MHLLAEPLQAAGKRCFCRFTSVLCTMRMANMVGAGILKPSRKRSCGSWKLWAPIEDILRVDLYGTAVLLEEVGKIIVPGGVGVTISCQSGKRMPQLTAEEDDPYECNNGTSTREGIQCRLIFRN